MLQYRCSCHASPRTMCAHPSILHLNTCASPPHSPPQGEEHIRKSALVKSEELTKWLFEDSKTVYECFQRGKRVSGECVGVLGCEAGIRWRRAGGGVYYCTVHVYYIHVYRQCEP